MLKSALLFLFILFLLPIAKVAAQQLSPAPGKVKVIQDDRIPQMAEQYRKANNSNPETDGYRVQVFFDSGTNSKSKAVSAKTDFEQSFPGVKTYLSYKEPYYRVRVGDFRSLIEAVGFQKKIAGSYPNAFPVRDRIGF
jgi:hypothetical protein